MEVMTKRAVIQVENTEKIIDLAKYLEASGWTIVTAGKNAELFRKEKIQFENESALYETELNSAEASKLVYNIMNTDEDGLEGNNIYLVCINVFPIPPARDVMSFNVRDANYYLAAVARGAFVNYQNVLILSDPDDYEEAMIQLRTDSVSKEFRLYLASKALNMVSAYDSSIASSILLNSKYGSPFMNYLMLPLKKQNMVHNGSNPQQVSCLYNYSYEQGATSGIKKLQGKELNYNIICDLSVAWEQISTLFSCLKNQFTVSSVNNEGYEFTSQFTPLTGTVFTVAVKFKSIIGAALSTNVLDSFKKTHTYDTETIDDVVLGCSAVIDKKAAEEIVNYKCAAIIAPSFTDDAKEILAANKNIRLIPTAKVTVSDYELQLVNGGMLLETRDKALFDKWYVKTRMRPSQKQTDELALGMLLAKNSRSYTAVLLRANSIVGISQACSSVRKAMRNVLIEAEEYIERNQLQGTTLGDILVSDAPIPFCKEVKELIEKGVTAIIQTGGTYSDDEFIKFCDERGVVMIFTNQTHILL